LVLAPRLNRCQRPFNGALVLRGHRIILDSDPSADGRDPRFSHNILRLLPRAHAWPPSLLDRRPDSLGSLAGLSVRSRRRGGGCRRPSHELGWRWSCVTARTVANSLF